MKVKSFSRVQLFATPWTAAYQAPLSMGFSRQGYWSGVPLPSLEGDHIHPSLLKAVPDFSHSPSVTVNGIPLHSQNHLNLEDKFSVNSCDSYSTPIYYPNSIIYIYYKKNIIMGLLFTHPVSL